MASVARLLAVKLPAVSASVCVVPKPPELLISSEPNVAAELATRLPVLPTLICPRISSLAETPDASAAARFNAKLLSAPSVIEPLCG